MLLKKLNNYIIIAIIPCLQYLVNDNIFLTNISADSWIYHGYFSHYSTFSNQLLGHQYYGTRLPWIIPGYVIYHLIPTLYANYVFHYLVYLGVTLPVYGIMQRFLNERIALISTTLMCCHPFFLWTIGWDYIDCSVLFYYVLTLFLLVQCVHSNSIYQSRISIFASGITFSGLIFTNIFCVIFLPVILIFFLALNQWKIQLKDWLWNSLRFILGFLAYTGLMAGINYRLNQTFLFFKPSIDFVVQNINATDNPWMNPDFNWLKADWLLLPILVLLCVFILALRDFSIHQFRLRAPQIVNLPFVLSFIIFLYWQLKGTLIFNTPDYTSYLIPLTFLSIGSLLSHTELNHIQNPKAPYYKLIAIGIIALSLIALSHPVIDPWLNLLMLLFPLFILGLGIITPKLLTPIFPIEKRLFLSTQIFSSSKVFLLFLISLVLLPANATYSIQHKTPSQSEAYRAIHASITAIEAIAPNLNTTFWYNINDKNGNLFKSIAFNTIPNNKIVSEIFPDMPLQSTAMDLLDFTVTPAIIKTNVTVKPYDTIAILTSEPDLNILKIANQSLKTHGLKATLKSIRDIQVGAIAFKIYMVELAIDDQAVEAGQPSFYRTNLQSKKQPGSQDSLIQDYPWFKSIDLIFGNLITRDFARTGAINVTPENNYHLKIVLDSHQYKARSPLTGLKLIVLGLDQRKIIADFSIDQQYLNSSHDFLINTRSNQRIEFIFVTLSHQNIEVPFDLSSVELRALKTSQPPSAPEQTKVSSLPEFKDIQNFRASWNKANYADIRYFKDASSKIQVTTDISFYNWQLASKPYVVEPNTEYQIDFDLEIESGGLVFSIIDQSLNSAIANQSWCYAPRSFNRKKSVVFRTNHKTRISIGFYNVGNCQSPLPSSSTFQISDLSIKKKRVIS